MGTVRRSALAAAHPAGGEGSSTNAAVRASTSPLQHALHLLGTPVACPGTPVGCRVACVARGRASVAVGEHPLQVRGGSNACPGWDVRGRVQSLTRRSITSQAMTAGELPLSKARPRSVRGCKDPAPAGHGWKWRQDRRATVERGEERAGPGRARSDEHLLPGSGSTQLPAFVRSRHTVCAGRAARWVGRRDAARADNGSTDDEPASSKARSVNAAQGRGCAERCAGPAGVLTSSATTR